MPFHVYRYQSSRTCPQGGLRPHISPPTPLARELAEDLNHTLPLALAPSTRRAYKKSWDVYRHFLAA